MKETLGRALFTGEEIQNRVKEIAEEVNRLYAGESLVVICVLKGAFMFYADLLRLVQVRPELDFVRIASYGNSSSSSRAISFTKDIEISIAGKHVLVVEDVVDSGHSMNFLLKQLEARGAKSLRLCALIDKRERRELPVNVDFAGFEVSGGFIVGYGMDYAERYRELPDIRLLELEDCGASKS
ncbi:MAG: hypoxanthine phosphoribosyltransferase [Deltaproteobacteria bacterium]|jgi:hypoxanthine phosphoribosyltransferase|nr:hypoxanthine phosphoribosyltransferase [Deltaproteobacteria bacterium]